jgi:hypothetical protein
MRLSTAEEQRGKSTTKRVQLFEDYLALIGKLGKDDRTSRSRRAHRAQAGQRPDLPRGRSGLTKGGAAEVRKKRGGGKSWIAADPARQKRFGSAARLEKHFAERKKQRS